MSGVVIADPVALIRERGSRESGSVLPAGLWRGLADAWLQRTEQQVALAVSELDHDDVLRDSRRACRG